VREGSQGLASSLCSWKRLVVKLTGAGGAADKWTERVGQG